MLFAGRLQLREVREYAAKDLFGLFAEHALNPLFGRLIVLAGIAGFTGGYDVFRNSAGAIGIRDRDEVIGTYPHGIKKSRWIATVCATAMPVVERSFPVLRGKGIGQIAFTGAAALLYRLLFFGMIAAVFAHSLPIDRIGMVSLAAHFIVAPLLLGRFSCFSTPICFPATFMIVGTPGSHTLTVLAVCVWHSIAGITLMPTSCSLPHLFGVRVPITGCALLVVVIVNVFGSLAGIATRLAVRIKRLRFAMTVKVFSRSGIFVATYKAAFYRGFHSVSLSPYLRMLLVSGGEINRRSGATLDTNLSISQANKSSNIRRY